MAVAGFFTRRPLYLQMRDALVERIATGKWRAGTTIPNETDLAREFGVSSGTMRKALDLMESERLVTRRQGRGTLVNDHGSAELATRFNNIRGVNGNRILGDVNAPEITEGTANKLECARLRLREGEPVFRIRCVRSHEDQPFMIEAASMPAALFPGLTLNGYPHRIVVLAQQHGILLGKAVEHISIGQATPEVAAALSIAPTAPIMVLDRVTQTIDGLPIEWRIGQCHLPAQSYLVEID